jgi:uncharacterized RmlC-like cupin family protein
MNQPGAKAVGFLGQYMPGARALMVVASSGSDSAWSTAVWAAALTMTSGATARTHVNEAGEIGEVATQAALTPRVIEGDDLAERRQTALQLPADLSAFPEEKDSHGWRSP